MWSGFRLLPPPPAPKFYSLASYLGEQLFKTICNIKKIALRLPARSHTNSRWHISSLALCESVEFYSLTSKLGEQLI